MAEKLFGTDGIRGQANRYPITAEVALRVGKAMGRVLQEMDLGSKRVLIGKDTRLSGYMLETALTSGLVAMGTKVYLVGPMPTPAVAHLTRSMGAAAGIMLTASHNPYDDNGIKIFGNDGFKLSDEVEALVEKYVQQGDLDTTSIRSDMIGKATRIDDARGRYIEFAKHAVGNHSLEGLRIVLDCANGAAYQVAPWILRELGAEVIAIHADPDGFNINNNCGATHPETMAEVVKQYRADVGVALDGDADRVIFCDAHGTVVSGDRILALCALDFKQQGRLAQDTLVVTTMSNLGLHEAMHNHGIRVLTTDVGDRKVIERMRSEQCNLGGENSGHLIFMDYATTGDGIISALQVLKLMRTGNATLRELAAVMQEFPQELVNMYVKEKRPLEELVNLQTALSECRQVLGTGGRTVIRYSGTESKLRLLIEAREESMVRHWAGQLAAAVQKDFAYETCL